MPYGYYYGFDFTYLLFLLPALIFALWAQARVQGTFNKYSKIKSARGITGADAARLVLQRHGIENVRIEHIRGNLTDHFDPRKQVIRLSDNVYNNTSISAIGVAAHEAGHAIQYAQKYRPIVVRNAVLPIAQIGSSLSWFLIIIGLVFAWSPLMLVGIFFFIGVLVFQLITLPVEYNASSRAVAVLAESETLSSEEVPGARKVLNAAAMTYVAAVVLSVAQLLRILSMYGRRR